MKLTISMKDPDWDQGDVEEAVRQAIGEGHGLDREEYESLVESRCEKVRQTLRRWLEWGEYLTVEFDLEAMTATVKEVKR